MLAVIQYPPELLYEICTHIYFAGLPAPTPSLDPLIQNDYGAPTSLPSSLPPGNWSEPLTRRTLATLCLVNRDWCDAARPWLWRKVEVRLPRSWVALVEEVIWGEDEANVRQTAMAVATSLKMASAATSTPTVLLGHSNDPKPALELEGCVGCSPIEPDGSIPPELLSPSVSRDRSPRRLRNQSTSPARWKIMRLVSNALETAFDRREPGFYVPVPSDPRPGRFVRHLDFNHFRTIGMRRSIEEGVTSPFVTGDLVEAILKEMPNLTTFGATEYMDGALALPVLKELLLRGQPSHGRGRSSRGRGVVNDPEEEDRERRSVCRDLEALDLTGCVSVVFANALTEFVNSYLTPAADSDSSSSEDEGPRRERRRRTRSPRLLETPIQMPSLTRLGLRGVKSISSRVLTQFVLAFPSLTHLDLSGTRATPDLLSCLGESTTVRLHSLALARCTKLTSESLKEFLQNSPVTSRIQELSLYGDMTFASPLSEGDLRDIMSHAPCFTSGELLYLDLSSAPITKDLLLNVCAAQPKLRSLGLSYIPGLELKAIADFILNKAYNVEVLTLVGTSPELGFGLRTATGPALAMQRGTARHGSVALHATLIRPLCTPPFSFSLSSPTAAPALPATRLRVIELSTAMLSGLGAGAGSWRIVRSKGGRGWYVDTASGWVAESGEESVLRRDLDKEHPFRVEMEKLADANGNVSSGVGWHARKMEILHGHGMLGREDGLYGAVSFAYQG